MTKNKKIIINICIYLPLNKIFLNIQILLLTGLQQSQYLVVVPLSVPIGQWCSASVQSALRNSINLLLLLFLLLFINY